MRVNQYRMLIMKPVYVHCGDSPVILTMPHTGTYVPDVVSTGLNANGKKLTDTDWHVDKLYKGLLPRATIIRANFHRYVIDANRDPSGKSLYPGQNTTDLCPITDFDNVSIYKKNREPSRQQIERRRHVFHAPYHQAIEKEITRLKQLHNNVVLYDCHSIRSHVPFLFEDILPDFNIGTYGGKSCAPELEKITADICNKAQGFTSVVNGRFKGGWTTRHYGKPHENIHAVQMELSQSLYMDEEAPWHYRPEKARETRDVLRGLLHSIESFAFNRVLRL